jgi:hypothetical protein
MRAQAISPTLLVELIADRIAEYPATDRVRVALDGAPAAKPGQLADDLVAPLRLRGRTVLRAEARHFLRPASLRLEFGRTDPDVYYDEWLDTKALTRELLDPLAADGTGRALPAFWDAAADRASRAEYVQLPPGGVLLLDGPLLLGRYLPFDLTVHLWLSPAALARRTPPGEAWTLPAYARYEDEVDPAHTATIVARVDDPAHPALVHQD